MLSPDKCIFKFGGIYLAVKGDLFYFESEFYVNSTISLNQSILMFCHLFNFLCVFLSLFSFNRYLKLGIPRCLQVLFWILWSMVQSFIFNGVSCWSHGYLLGTYVQLPVQHRKIYIQ